jgi:hypothetical protein
MDRGRRPGELIQASDHLGSQARFVAEMRDLTEPPVRASTPGPKSGLAPGITFASLSPGGVPSNARREV